MAITESQAEISGVLRLVEIEGKGRGLVASHPLKGGQIVMQDSPILAYSTLPLKRQQEQEGNSYGLRYCAHCYRRLKPEGGGGGDTTTFICPLCSHPDDAIFCSFKCQSLALSSTHTPWVCDSLSYLRLNCRLLLGHQPVDRQVQARYLVAAYNLAMVSPSAFRTLLSLAGSEPRISETSIFLHSIVSLLSFPDGFSDFSVEITASLLAKERCNSFSLMEPYAENGGRSARAYAVYPKASFFNHDCLPNACRFDYPDSENDGNTDLIIRMIHDVPRGQEICLSYFRVNLSYCERKKRLRDDFGFACLCARCKVEANEAIEKENKNNRDGDFPHAYFFERFMCDRENCGGTLAPVLPSDGIPTGVMECNFCGHLIKKDLSK